MASGGVVKKTKYRYAVRTGNGQLKKGRALAPNSAQLRRLLTGRGYSIVSIAEERGILGNITFGRISPKERSLVYKELATMLKAGVAITQSIEIIADTPDRRLRKVLTEIASSLENGFPLSVAMAGHPKTFPVVEIGVVKAGEATGNLSKVLEELARSTQRSADFAGRIRGALTYPAFVVFTMIIVGTILITKVIPPIKSIFESTGADLPLSTRILLSTTDFIIKDWYWVAGALLVVVLAFWITSLFKKGKRLLSRMKMGVPVFGDLLQQSYLARFNRTLSLMVTSGVPIIEAINIISESTTDITFRESLVELMHSLEQGAAISATLQKNKYFPKLMTQLLFVGQQSGDLGGASATLAEYFESEVDTRLQTLSALLEPFIIVILGAAVGFVVVSVLQPIYSLSGVL